MMKQLSIMSCLLLMVSFAFTQPANTIKGKITDKKNGLPIPNCSVFINSTTKGTITNDKGEFELKSLPEGRYDLVVSSIGYETYIYTFSTNQLPIDLSVSLKQKETELSAVTVIIEPFLKDGWETWGEIFIANFLGTSYFVRNCTIKNKEVVHFRFSQKKNILSAVADEPIIIENEALGYVIKYQLKDFSIDFNSQKSVYYGYPLFSDIPSNSKMQQLRWEKNRDEAYYGSLMHFIRCLYKGDLQKGDQFNQEGFEVRRHIKLLNAEKLRVKEKYEYLQYKDESVPKDSLKYYKRILKQPDSIVSNPVLSSTDIVSVNEDGNKTLFFTGNISITYRKRRGTHTEVQNSTIYLITPAPVQIEKNGYYFSPSEIFTIGYWNSSQKLANLLPFDFWPGEELFFLN